MNIKGKYYTVNFKEEAARKNVDVLLPELMRLGWEISHEYENNDEELYNLARAIDLVYSKRHPYFPVFGNIMIGDWTCENNHGFTPRGLQHYFTPKNPPPKSMKKLKCPICGGQMSYDEAM